MKSKLRILVSGLVAQHPGLGGVAWDYLQYVVGFARLGHDVWYLEDSGEWPYRTEPDADGSFTQSDPTPNLLYLEDALKQFGLSGRWMYRYPLDGTWYGLSEAERRQVMATADVLINVSGVIENPQEYSAIPVRVYIDSDPVFTQIKLDELTHNTLFQQRFKAHNVFFSFGETIHQTSYAGAHTWIPTRQPVLLEEWECPPPPPGTKTFTTVMNWTSYKPVTYRGMTFGQKDIQLRKLLDLPQRVENYDLEIALGRFMKVHTEWQTEELQGFTTPRELLEAHGWKVRDASEVTSTIESYRNYIKGSFGEFSVAKHGYVTGQTGWFSCRTACYLAAGRPVVVEDTGFRDVLPTGEGLLSFRNQEEALEAIRQIGADPQRHSEAAREIANEWFDYRLVLTDLLEKAGSFS